MYAIRKTLAGAAVAAAALAAAPAAGAITNGQPDEGRNPSVGALVSHDGRHRKLHLICSGTLVAPTVFLTAAHCLEDEPSRLYVSFDAFVGAPDVGPGVTLFPGTATGHAEYADSTAPGDTHDVAVVRLDDPVEHLAPVPLPYEGELDAMAGAGTLGSAAFELVGYGREGFDGKRFFGGGSRRFALGAFSSLEPFKLLLDQSGETGGTCNGDSGGPVLVADRRFVAGVTSDGDAECRVNGVYYRVDTPQARSFLDDFVAQPQTPVDPPPDTTPPNPPPGETPPATTPPPHVTLPPQARVVGRFARARRGVRVRRLSVHGVASGTVVEVRCEAPRRDRRACPPRVRRRAPGASVRLGRLMARRVLRRGSVLEVRVRPAEGPVQVVRWNVGRRGATRHGLPTRGA